jgi:hypothetical protein
VVELVAVEIKTADQCANGAIARVGDHQRGFYDRHLNHVPAPFFILADADNGTTTDALCRSRLFAEHAGSKLQSILRDLDPLPAGTVYTDLFG